MSLAFFSLVVLFLKWLCQGKEMHVVKNESVSFGAISRRGPSATSHHGGQQVRTRNEEVPELSVKLPPPQSDWGTEGLWLGWKATRQQNSSPPEGTGLSKTEALSSCRTSLVPLFWEVTLDGKTASYLPSSDMCPRTHRRVCPETGLPQPQRHSLSPTLGPPAASLMQAPSFLPQQCGGSYRCSGGRGR